MKRLTMGAVLGGLAVYLFDPELGEERRERLSSIWRENRGSVVQAGRVASQAAESARPLARRMTKAVSLPKLIGAAVIGGTLVYFMDPVRGSERRRSTLAAGRQAFTQVAKAVKPGLEHLGDRVAGAGERVKSKVS